MKAEARDFLYEAYETELGGIQVYTNAVKAAQNDELKKEWKKYLRQTQRHERILRSLLKTFRLDPAANTPGRDIVRHHGRGLVRAIQMALKKGKPNPELVAAECVVLAETKDHLNWELIGELAKHSEDRAEARALKSAYDKVEDEEDEHLYHTQGWTRELWMSQLRMPAVLPPPEETKEVKTAIGAARAKQARGPMARSAKSRKARDAKKKK